MKRGQFKKQLKAKKARAAEKRSRNRDLSVRRGFRKMVVEGEVYQWRYYGTKVEIRTPYQLDKWMVPIWALQGHKTEEAWLKEHKDCCREGCCDQCNEYAATPGMVREYIDKKTEKTAGI